jgi:hypothetical protein
LSSTSPASNGTFFFLFKQKVNLNFFDKICRQLIHFAAWKHYLEIVEILVDNGMKVDAADNGGRTPLHYAAKILIEGNHRIFSPATLNVKCNG